jgi:glutathione-regulated potassium-efflux system ancillary protein KefC
MDFLWIFVAFGCGFAARQIKLPPLVGYLCAGFGLHAFGWEPFDGLSVLSDLGITLLLFTIGLKISLKDLMSPVVSGSALSHMAIWTGIFSVLLVTLPLLFASYHFGWMTGLLLGFALSFSSTVCVMKMFEENAELKTKHSNLAIGVLIIQDIVAVLFLVMATGIYPTPWALLILLMPLARPLIIKLMDLSGHGELLVLIGFFMALGGAEIFKLVNIKGDLGALMFGMMIAGTPKANELYKSLIGFKDLFLIGFFLLIGFSALPTWELLGWAILLVALLPVKMLLYFALFLAFRMRARTALLSSLALMNFSEFGLIVAKYSVDKDWLSPEALVVMAMAVSISFATSSLTYNYAHLIYTRLKDRIRRFEVTSIKDQAEYDCPTNAEVLIIGMGRVGSGAYAALQDQLGGRLWGVEADAKRVALQKERGMQVVAGDADDIDFWEQLDYSNLRLVMLAIPSVQEMKNIIYQLKQTDFQGKIATIAHFDDEQEELCRLGADVAFNFYSEVGAGFAEESAHLLKVTNL